MLEDNLKPYISFNRKACQGCLAPKQAVHWGRGIRVELYMLM